MLSVVGLIAGLTASGVGAGPATPPATQSNTPTAAATADSEIEFARDIRPILSDNCFTCHGPDEKKRKAKLRLDTEAGAFADLGGYAAIVPGKPEKSAVFTRLTTTDEDDLMPPKKTGKHLKPTQIELIKRWIEQGAKWQGHWSFIAPKRPPQPQVTDATKARNAIDYYILARLQREGLKPSPEADRRTLIRRVTFDLTGLPPTPQEVQAFVEDTSPDAYEKVVDRLLRSPHYGEHMARFWLDVARYGDTHGLHLDNYREMWPYRDWVINAFNDNKSFDTFVIEQLAGDLLPGATLDQIVASGFNRCHVTTSEGGSIAEEVYVRNVVDRVSTTTVVFMGLAGGCAVCHDHKFDPLTSKDFYSMFAYFNSLDANPLDGNAKDPAPVIRVATKEQSEKLAAIKAELAKVDETIRTQVAAVNYVEPAAEQAPQPPKPMEVVWIEDNVPDGANAQGNTPWQWVNKGKGEVFSGNRASRRQAKGLSQHFFTGAKQPLRVGAGDTLFTYVFLDPKDPPKEIMLQWNDGVWEHRAYWGGNHIDWGGEGSPSRRPMGELPKAGEWVRLEVSAEHVGLAPGALINGWAFTQFDGTVLWDKAGIVTLADQRPGFDSLKAWLAYERTLNDPTTPKDLDALIKLEDDKRNDAQRKQLADYFIEHVYTATRARFDPLHQQQTQLNKQATDLENAFPTTLVSKESGPRDAFILKRGEYDDRGDKVTRATPAFLPPMPEGAPNDRLGFAKWLMSPEHPLTARVAVNRFWQQLFGIGVVKTSEEFGSQGEPPSHPQLLDWLAVEFRESGWNIKGLMKTMVMSATYRQSSQVSKELALRDPENRLLARGPRFRLDAEMLRDQMLSVSGLLVDAVGGPSVKPPQPEGLWEAVGYTSSNTARFSPDKGEKVYRRGLYTFWKRTAVAPQMATFDAPSREACTMRRERTNTPMQALLLMNEEQNFEAARRFAERTIKGAPLSPEARIAFMTEHALCRPPTKQDTSDLLDAYHAFESAYKQDVESARKAIAVGETKPDPALDPADLAAWTLVANVIMNTDEFVTKN